MIWISQDHEGLYRAAGLGCWAVEGGDNNRVILAISGKNAPNRSSYVAVGDGVVLASLLMYPDKHKI